MRKHDPKNPAPKTGPGSMKIAAPFTPGDPRAARGGKAKKKNRIGRESAMATCRRMNFDGVEQLILIAQGNTHALEMEEGSISPSLRLNATKEVLSYVMVKKQNVAIIEGGGSEGAAVTLSVQAPVNTNQSTQIKLEDARGSVIDMPALTQDDLDSINDGVIDEDLIEVDMDE